jgi:hypothetical protein
MTEAQALGLLVVVTLLVVAYDFWCISHHR